MSNNRKFNRTAQAPMQTILVAGGNQALATGALTNGSNSLGIANQQLGVLSTDTTGVTATNTFITAGQTTQQVKSIKVLRGTPNSANLAAVSPFRLNDQAYLSSNDIFPEDIVEVATTLPEVGTLSMDYLASFTSPSVGLDYDLTITLESVENDIDYAAQRLNTSVFSVTAANPAPAFPTDAVLQNLALQANRQSIYKNATGDPYIVLGIDTTGAAAGVAVSGIVAGTSIPVFLIDGVQTNYVATTEFVAALQRALTAAAFAGTVEIVNLGSVTPGTANTCNALLVVGLKDSTAVVLDEFTRRNVKVEAASTLANTRTVASFAKDWVGTGKQWFFQAKKFAKQHLAYFENWYGSDLSGSMETSPFYVSNSEDVFYTSTNVTYNTIESHSRNLEKRTPHVLTILIPATITNPAATAAQTYTFASSDAATVTALNASLGAWLQDAHNKWTNHKYEFAATAAAPFV